MMRGMHDGDATYAGIEERRLALVVVDIQKKFLAQSPGLVDSIRSRLDGINRAIDLFRSTGNPVIFLFYEGDGHCLAEASEDPDGLIDGLSMEENDLRVSKTWMNSFRDSELGDRIRELGCDGIVLVGLVAQYCVLATYYGAFDNGLCPYIMRGGIAAEDEAYVERVEGICKTVTLDDIRRNVHFC